MIKEARLDFTLDIVFVLEPMTTWDSPGARETGRPSMKMGGAPATRVCPLMTTSDAGVGFGVDVCMMMVEKIGRGSGVRVVEPMIKALAEGARENGFPLMVIGARSGIMV